MINIREYPGLYYQFDGIIRKVIQEQGYAKNGVEIRKMPGYELLRIAWIAIQVDKSISDNEIVETVLYNQSVATSSTPGLLAKNRDPIIQKMVEVVRCIGDEDSSPMEFIRNL